MNIGVENSFSPGKEIKGDFNFSLSGTWVATVHVQRSFDRYNLDSDSDATWVDVDSFTANTEQIGLEPQSRVYYRWGIKTGNYTSGTAVGDISQ